MSASAAAAAGEDGKAAGGADDADFAAAAGADHDQDHDQNAAPDGDNAEQRQDVDAAMEKNPGKAASWLTYDGATDTGDQEEVDDDDEGDEDDEGDDASVREAEDLSDGEEPHDSFGKLAYLTKCDDMGLVPVSQVLKYLEQEDMQLTHYGGETSLLNASTVLFKPRLTFLHLVQPPL